MILWHVAATMFLFRWIFRDPKVDVRFLIAGALLPDVIDLPIGTLVFADRFSSGEIYAHTLIVPTVVAIGILVATRRGRRRRAWMALIVAWFLHLLIDGMWTTSETFLWPFFGWEFAAGPDPYWGGFVERMTSDPWRWVTEVVGATYLWWLWNSSGLADPAVRRSVMSDGRLPSPAPASP